LTSIFLVIAKLASEAGSIDPTSRKNATEVLDRNPRVRDYNPLPLRAEQSFIENLQMEMIAAGARLA
jgi:hypothetical protein